MFKCDSCRQYSKPREGQNKVVVETRQVEYTNTVDEKIKTTYGYETVSEITVCTNCVGKYATT